MISNDFGAPVSPRETRKLSLNSTDEDYPEVDTEPEPGRATTSFSAPKCWLHLKELFTNSIDLFNKETVNDQSHDLIDPSLPIILCGFSKGCIVLNQLCTELEYFSETTSDTSLNAFRDRISHLIYLDGGHCGTSNAWITREETISLVKCLNWTAFVYITPYNIVCRSVKLWAIKEYEIFLELLKKYGVTLVNKCYFEDEEKDFDLNKHFEILNEFEIFPFLSISN